MKLTLKLAIALFLVGASVSLAQPKLHIVGGDKVDWGKVTPKESPLQKKVEIKNTGDQELHITNVKPSCGCTTAPLEKDKLKPGESTFINLTFKVGNNPGVNTKTVRISSNDPATPEKTFRISAELVKNLVVSPTEYLAFNEMQVGKQATSAVTIKNTSNKTITLMDPKVTPSDLTVNLKGKKTLKPGESFELKATITPAKTGYLNMKVTIPNDDAETGDMELNGYGNVMESPIFNSKK